MLADQVERQQRMAKMVQDAEKQHDIEPLVQCRDVVDRELGEFDVAARDLGGKPRLAQVAFVDIDRQHPGGAAPLHFERVETAVAADIEHAAAGQIGWDGMREAAPFDGWIVAEEMVGRGLHAAEIDVVEPRPQRRDVAAQLLGRRSGHQRRLPPAWIGIIRRVPGAATPSASRRIASR